MAYLHLCIRRLSKALKISLCERLEQCLLSTTLLSANNNLKFIILDKYLVCYAKLLSDYLDKFMVLLKSSLNLFECIDQLLSSLLVHYYFRIKIVSKLGFRSLRIFVKFGVSFVRIHS